MLRSFRTRLDASAEQIAKAIEQAIKETAAAGKTPTGESWALRKDGARAMPNAADAIGVEYRKIGNTHYIYVRVGGGYFFHDIGRARGGIRRQILPDQVSPELAARIEQIISKCLTPSP